MIENTQEASSSSQQLERRRRGAQPAAGRGPQRAGMGQAGICVPLGKPGGMLYMRSPLHLPMEHQGFFFLFVILSCLEDFWPLLLNCSLGNVQYFTVQDGFSLEVRLMGVEDLISFMWAPQSLLLENTLLCSQDVTVLLSASCGKSTHREVRTIHRCVTRIQSPQDWPMATFLGGTL